MKNDARWLERFLQVARVVSTWSKEPEGSTGAVLVSPDGRQVCWGYNGPPSEMVVGSPHTEHVIHAELNAILNAKRDLSGWSLAVTRFPCHDCALIIAQAGIKNVAILEPVRTTSRWYGSQQQAMHVFKASDVKLWLPCDGHLLPL